ncbi:MAG: rpsQ [Chlamydiales bacterium]|jgi:small subunit ribosomal protein S17|nr:rpsQ [Chlamydiales bacterium]
MNNDRGKRKLKKGVVISNKMDKTVVVRVDTTMRHPTYQKVITYSKKYYVHDESDSLQVGDTVMIMETRPLSKLKRWRAVPAA